MSNVKFELNHQGVRELLRSDEMMAVCRSCADAARSRLGEGYTVTTFTGRNRVNASVYADTVEARRENAAHNSILKAVGGG